MYNGAKAEEEEGRHALKASDTYIFKCTNCFPDLNVSENQGEALQNSLTVRLQTQDLGASAEAWNQRGISAAALNADLF